MKGMKAAARLAAAAAAVAAMGLASIPCSASTSGSAARTAQGERQEDIEEEIRLGELEELAQLVRAEAGNQDAVGKMLVAEVVLNRVESEGFPDTVSGVIYQRNQFSCIDDGNFRRAQWDVDESDYRAVVDALEGRAHPDIVYYRTGRYSSYGEPAFKYGSHYFSR